MEAIRQAIDHMEFKRPGRVAFTSLEVLPMLKGKEFDDRALAFMASLRPSCIAVIIDPGRMQVDHVPWRVRVFLKNGLIDKITQSVEVGLPKRFAHFSDLEASLKETNEPKNADN